MNGHGDSSTRRSLSIVIVVMIAASLGVLFVFDVPPSNRELVSMIIGALLTKLTDVFAYNFNTTASSQLKDRTIAAMADTKAKEE